MQSIQRLQAYIDHFFPLQPDEWRALKTLMRPMRLPKGSAIFPESETADALYFVAEGIVRAYRIDERGDDYTWAFHCLDTGHLERRMLLDAIAVDYASFTRGTPQELAFETLCDTLLYRVDKSDILQLYASAKRWQTFARYLAEEAYATLQERAFEFQSKRAKERLLMLKQVFPALFEKRVPTVHIASYLGIRRQSFNRLRRELGL